MVLGGQIPEPARFGIDIIFPAAMIGIAVGLITGRRELVGGPGRGRSSGSSSRCSARPSIGIIVGGLVGPLVGLLVPAAARHESAPIGTPASADRYAMPGTHLDEATDQPLAARPTTRTDAP